MPAGTTTIGNPISTATVPTIAWEPSPPAMPRTSTPLAATSRTTCSQSWPGSSTTGWMPRLVHSSTRWNRSALPPPDLRFMNRTPRVAAGTGVPSVSLCLSAPTVVPSAYFARATATTSKTMRTTTDSDAVALRVDHADDQRDDCGHGHDHGGPPTRLRRGERHPGATDRHDDEEEFARDAQRLVDDPADRGHDHAGDQQDGDDRRQPLSAGGLDSGAHQRATLRRPDLRQRTAAVTQPCRRHAVPTRPRGPRIAFGGVIGS